jgi:hypothetical protein
MPITWTEKNVRMKLELFPEIAGMTILEYKDFRQGCGLDLPSILTISKLYGSWNEFKTKVYGGL